MMKNTGLSFSGKARKLKDTATVHTTLYNIIDAINIEVGPEGEEVLMATVAHLLSTRRVTCMGDMKGYRLILG
jgi:hypothetical protein